MNYHDTPTVSIVIPIYNRSRYLPAAIDSLLSQTYSNVEIILWDDQSTDTSLGIARHYAIQHPRVRVVAGLHQGQTQSLKSAFAMTSGTYLAWIDSDDLLAPTALEETIAILDANSHIGLVYTNYLCINETNQILGLGQRCRIPYSRNQLLVHFMVFHFRLMRRSVFEQVGGIDEQCDFVQDYDLCLRFSEVTGIYHLQRPLYYYRVHPQSMSQQQQADMIQSAQAAINRALYRRSLADRYQLQVQTQQIDGQLVGQFSLQPKNLTLTPQPGEK
ncbi:glycosyltransferase [Oculatella sp. LEGE 06141]|uniref:glycosyltransferase n=1 Tax=Oculatella sp. LEGE 06141 TaxID=1828648 RepID=UPI001882A641|nr:glycosyltransferase [Oculatella sp. LEGE 06141]MBE9182615.1 glycosyltransferase [Oculatella sp. LEGE 06141]